MREAELSAQVHDWAQQTADLLGRIRARAPRIHCITNAVAQNVTANVLLAVGAVPSMTISEDEVAAFARGADALLVNLGTFDAARRVAAESAIGTVCDSGNPWILDPVFIDRSPPRARFARDLLARKPAAIRLNAAEYAVLTGGVTRSPDSAALDIATWARRNDCVLALTGRIDHVTDGVRGVDIANGHPLMAKVTAMGDALSALSAACLAVEPDAWLAVAGAVLAFGVAGEVAAREAAGPGSFAVGIIDALHGLDAQTLTVLARTATENPA